MAAQTAALIALALLVVQVVGYFLLLGQQQRAVLIEASEPGVRAFVQAATRAQQLSDSAASDRLRAQSDFRNFFSATGESRAAARGVARNADLERRTMRALNRAGVHPIALEAGYARGPRFAPFAMPPPGAAPLRPPHDQGAPPFAAGEDADGRPIPPPMRLRAPPPAGDLRQAVFSAEIAPGRWINLETAWRAPPRDFLPRVLAAEALLYVTILAATLFLAHRIATPLRALAHRSAHVGRPGPPPHLALEGPSEVRAVIQAFNEMSTRVADLLREKDEMLGAIGHDLRTPIASLRLRAESIADTNERSRVIGTLNEMDQLLADTLDMARVGYSTEPQRLVDMNALADSLVEDYRDAGADVRFEENPRAPVFCRPTLTRRMVRNLIDNALKFGVRATVRVRTRAGEVVLEVADEGPGVPEDELGRVLAPFVRVERSRNRASGGAGLGLAIAARIAAAENASLKLENRPEGGLSAQIAWPKPH